jgi:SAM-dependent methyltransferase
MNLTNQLSRSVRALGVAPFFPAFRPGVPGEVVDLIVRAAGRDAAPQTLLDLGTGGGQAVQALHPYFRDIIAVDPVKEILDLAERDLRRMVSPGTRLRTVHSRAEQFAPPDGWTASLVTMCRSFHWMDEPVVLARLARIVRPAGVVAAFRDRGYWTFDNDWKTAVRAVIDDFGVEAIPERARPPALKAPGKTYGEFLAESEFGEVEEITVPVRRAWSSDMILGYLHSTRYAAPALLGDRAGEFEREIRRVLADYSDDDTFFEDDEFLVCFGRRKRA